jgi:PAS domain S-box-containing protein
VNLIQRGAVVDISNAVAEAILSMKSDAIIAADREGVIHFWNPGAARLFGYSPDEAISRSRRRRRRHAMHGSPAADFTAERIRGLEGSS